MPKADTQISAQAFTSLQNLPCWSGYFYGRQPPSLTVGLTNSTDLVNVSKHFHILVTLIFNALAKNLNQQTPYIDVNIFYLLIQL